MKFTIVHSLNQFNSLYESKLKEPSCLPICMEDLCAGWTTDSFYQILSRLTLKFTICAPLVIQKPEELAVFSNKINTLHEVFKLFDTRGLSRIDGMELICCFAIISSGTLQKKLETCFCSFSLNEDPRISKEAFCFFLDTYIRGLSKVLLVTTDTFYPKHPNYRLSIREIELVANAIFKNNEDKLSPGEFYAYLQQENGPLKKTFTTYPTELQKAQENYRDIMSNRLKTLPFIKNLVYDLINKLDFKYPILRIPSLKSVQQKLLL